MTGTAPAAPVTVVIPARDETATLPGALASVAAQDHAGPVEIVVADGSEGPDMAAMVRREFPGVRVVANPDRGISAGLNRAVAAASHDVIVRCDARSVLAPDHVRRCVEALERTGSTRGSSSATARAGRWARWRRSTSRTGAGRR